MENSIEIIKPGSKVMIGEHHQRKAHVSQATISESGFVSYEVIWWDGDTRNNMWIGHNEVEPIESSVMRVNLVIQ